mmetsp:Transcript_35221/g.97423  ORF Transcript_35221/g.97423 Transcript_35221/m.97423 type:complete len:262 (-) Transcript_35221:1479-2264(-)
MRRRRLHRRQRRPVPRAVRRRRDRRTRESHPERRGHGRVVPLGQGLRAAAQPQLRGHAAAGRPLTRDVAAQRDIVPHAVLPRVGAVHPAARQEHRLPQGDGQVLHPLVGRRPRVRPLLQLRRRAILPRRAGRAHLRAVAAHDGVDAVAAGRPRCLRCWLQPGLHRRGALAVHADHLRGRAREGEARALRDLLVFAPLLRAVVHRAAAARTNVPLLGAARARAVHPRSDHRAHLLPRQQADGPHACLLLGQWTCARRDHAAV